MRFRRRGRPGGRRRFGRSRVLRGRKFRGKPTRALRIGYRY